MPLRRDAEGKPMAGPTWESLSERLIREAMERGEFDDLPFRGERIPLDDDTYGGSDALALHVLKNAGVAPPWIEADKEARRLLEALDRLLAAAPRADTEMARERARAELRRIVSAANAAIDRLNAEAPGPAQHRRRLDLSAELERLERSSSEGR
jgi:hypothetical protein